MPSPFGEYPVLDLPFDVAIDLSGNIYAPITETAGKAVLAADGAKAIGFLQNKPDGTNSSSATGSKGATVRVLGVTKVVAGAAIAAMAPITPSGGTGKVRTGIATDFACGVAMEAAAADGDVIHALVVINLLPLV